MCIKINGVFALICILMLPVAGFTQPESPFIRSLRVDIGYAFPTYYGDFSAVNGNTKQFVEQSGTSPIDLFDEMQFNQNSVSGSIMANITGRLSGRLKFSQTTFFFSEDAQARVNFKNTVFDIAFLAQYSLFESFIDGYIFGGPGVNFHKDAEIFDTSIAAQTSVNTERNQSISTTLGLGLEFDVNQRFSVFAEATYLNTGSDRIDGYNGFAIENDLTQVLEEEDSYLKRDYFLQFGGGIRFKLFAAKSPEKSDQPEVPVAPTPVPEDSTTIDRAEKQYTLLLEEPELTISDKEKTLNILLPTDLSGGYLIKVNFVLTLEELRQQYVTASHIKQLVFNNGNVKILLVKEPNGYAVYYGYFNSIDRAKDNITRLRRYYSETTLIKL